MNKKIIALAVAAGLAVPGIAAAEIKVIGQAQLELVSTSSSTGGPTEGLTLDDGAEGNNLGSGNASALGVTGSHDVGNGMTGLYKINFNFRPDDDNNNGLGSNRDTWVGLKGGFGTVLIGRMNTPYKSSTVSWDPLLATFMQARGQNGMTGGSLGTGHNGYIDNTIAYANNFGSVKFVGAIGIDESTNNSTSNETDGDHAMTFSVNIPVADTVELAIAYLDAGSDLTDSTQLKVGAKWKASSDITVAGQYETSEVTGIFDSTNLYANVQMAMGGGASIVAAVGTQTDESTGGNNDGTYLALAYKKALSKKVSTHVGLVQVDEGVVGQNQDTTRIGAGVRVKF